jgi:hypothetical protein
MAEMEINVSELLFENQKMLIGQPNGTDLGMQCVARCIVVLVITLNH